MKSENGNGLDPELQSVLECQGDDNAIATVAELAVSAVKPGWMEYPGNDNRRVMVNPDGTLGEVWTPGRETKALSIAGFLEQVNDLASLPGERVSDTETTDRPTNEIRIFVGDGSIVAVCNERTTRRDTVTLKLNRLESIDKLLRPENMQGMTQKSLEWMLRSTYANRVTPETFLPAIRKLKITGSSNGSSVVAHGNETVDMSIEAEIAGVAGGIDEEIILSTSIYAELADGTVPPEYRVRCSVLIDVSNQKFTIKPLEGEVARAMAAARQEIIARLKEVELPDNVSVFSDSCR